MMAGADDLLARACPGTLGEMGICLGKDLCMADDRVRILLGEDKYHIPRTCEICGGVMVFQGVGEYKCEECKHLQYDDYGKVRKYIEEHPGATAAQVEEKIGVRQKSIRQMLRESRIEITLDSNCFLVCEMCHKPIRSGVYCPECEMKYHRMLEETVRKQRHSKKIETEQGFSVVHSESAEGAKRFKR